MYRLLFQSGPHKGRRLAVQQGTVVIGRDPECHIHLNDEQISWKHAVIEEREDGIYVRDMGSLNKIILNGEEVREARLSHGDTMTFGETSFQFQRLEPMVQEEGRRVSHVQGITFAAVALVVLLEIIFLVGLSVWRVDQGLEPKPESEEESTKEVAAEIASVESATEAGPEVVAEADEMDPADDAEPGRTEKAAAELPAENPEKPAGPGDEPAVEEQEDGPVDEKAQAADEPEAEPEPVSEPEPQKKEKPKPVSIELSREEKAALKAISPESLKPDETETVDYGQEDDEEVAVQPDYEKEDPLLDLAREMLEEARQEIRQSNYVQADQQLERLQIVAPDYYPAYPERAQLFEMRGMLKEAGEQWAELLDRSGGTPWYRYAARERARVARVEQQRPKIEIPAGARPPKKRIRHPERVRIESIQRQRFSGNDQFDEMRLITVTLKQRSGRKVIYGQNVEIEAKFFDRIKTTDEVRPTRAFVQIGRAHV